MVPPQGFPAATIRKLWSTQQAILRHLTRCMHIIRCLHIRACNRGIYIHSCIFIHALMHRTPYDKIWIIRIVSLKKPPSSCEASRAPGLQQSLVFVGQFGPEFAQCQVLGDHHLLNSMRVCPSPWLIQITATSL